MSNYPAPIPTVITEPVIAPPEEVFQHAQALGLPAGARIACYRLGPLDALDRRLTGVVWDVFGCEVDITDDPPDYPFLWLQWRGRPHLQLQIWRWRIYPAQPPAFAELRWSPSQEPYVHLCHLSLNAAQRLLQRNYLEKCVKATQKISRTGRPLDTGTWRTTEEFLQEVEPLVRECWQATPPVRPTETRIVAMLTRWVTAPTLGAQCQRHLGVDWNTYIERVRLS
jgi:hypothetical protein